MFTPRLKDPSLSPSFDSRRYPPNEDTVRILAILIKNTPCSRVTHRWILFDNETTTRELLFQRTRTKKLFPLLDDFSFVVFNWKEEENSIRDVELYWEISWLQLARVRRMVNNWIGRIPFDNGTARKTTLIYSRATLRRWNRIYADITRFHRHGGAYKYEMTSPLSSILKKLCIFS